METDNLNSMFNKTCESPVKTYGSNESEGLLVSALVINTKGQTRLYRGIERAYINSMTKQIILQFSLPDKPFQHRAYPTDSLNSVVMVYQKGEVKQSDRVKGQEWICGVRVTTATIPFESTS